MLHSGWATRNRGSRGTGWGPVNGVMLHQTVTKGVDYSISLAINGKPDEGVPGPLYAGLIDKAGVLHMVGWGRCNHAGLGDDDVLRAVIREDDPLPPDNEANTDGNSRFYGFAFINLGDKVDPYPTAQLRTGARVAALLCKEHGWTARSIVGHYQWQPGKVDPRGPQGYLIPSIRQIAHEWVAP